MRFFTGLSSLLRRLPGLRIAALCVLLTVTSGAHAIDVAVRIAVPTSTSVNYSTLSPQASSCVSVLEPLRLCAYVARGNDYQVLQWLLTAQLDGAVVSGLTWELLQHGGEADLKEQFEVLTESPWPEVSLPASYFTLRARQGGREAPDARLVYEGFLRSLLDDANDAAPGTIYLPSHLSPALPWLFERASEWLAGQNRDTEARSDFWKRFLHRLRFRVEAGAPLPEGTGEPHFFVTAEPQCLEPRAMCLKSEPERDVLVLRNDQRRRTDADEPKKVALPALYARWIAASDASGGAPLNPVVRDFIARNYEPVVVGSRMRYRFLFTLDELWPVFALAGRARDDGGLALVLTGGGVKAAYQTRLIDHFYKERWLVNDLTARPRPGERTLPVKFVIGTSGGALLGGFVAARTPQPEVNFSDRLWHRKADLSQPIDSTDVFPWIDLMRWLSFLACVLAFVLAAGLRSLWRWVRGGPHRTQRRVSEGAQVQRWFRLMIWFVLLAATPYLIRYTNGDAAVEHIPEIEGFFYFFCAVIAIYSDARMRSLTPLKLPARRAAVWPLAVLAAGVVLSLGAWFLAKFGVWPELVQPLDWIGYESRITVPALIACIGTLAIFYSVHRLIDPARGVKSPMPQHDIWLGFVLLIIVVVATNLIYWIVVAAGWGTWSEFSLIFWAQLLGLAFFLSLLLFYLADGKHTLKAVRRWVQPGINYLLSLHPSRLLVWRQRHWRIFMFFAMAWVWWNLVMAPAIYGNEKAREYFGELFVQVAQDYGAPCESPASPGELCLRLQTFFVAPVTALSKGKEIYVLFQPETEYRRPGAWYALGYDPRWRLVPDQSEQDRLLEKIVFASGSPFPIFPAHRIDLKEDEFESLVDGGYAHNVPVEAAKRLGASRVLVLSSSPWARAAAGGGLWWAPAFGPLFNQIWRLVPYLFERSQIEDVLSAQDMMVARIAPSADSVGWPFLMDFRAPVVRRMLSESGKDLSRRIADIESWGRPPPQPIPDSVIQLPR